MHVWKERSRCICYYSFWNPIGKYLQGKKTVVTPFARSYFVTGFQQNISKYSSSVPLPNSPWED